MNAVAQPKKFEGTKSFDFRWATVFCWEHRLSKHKTTVMLKTSGMAPLALWMNGIWLLKRLFEYVVSVDVNVSLKLMQILNVPKTLPMYPKRL